jgi:sarcosine oxidase, subunit beta
MAWLGSRPRSGALDSMTDHVDVAIVGTGLFGAALADWLGREGDLRVAAVGRARGPDRPDGTSASAGILSVQGWDPWDLAIVRESTAEYVRLADEQGIEPLRQDGGIRVARTPEGQRWLERVERVLAGEQVETLWLGEEDLATRLPFATLEGVRAALYTPEDASIAPEACREAYLRTASRRGVNCLALAQPVTLERRKDGFWWLEGPVEIAARELVLAAGADTKALLARLGCSLPLAPFRAQALRIRPKPLVAPGPALHDLDLTLYVRPSSHGRLLAGDGTGPQEADPASWDPRPDAGFLQEIEEGIRSVFGGLDGLTVESAWAGLCVATPDRFPLVGRVPGHTGLYVAAGFNGFGTMRAAGLARRLAGAIRTGGWEGLAHADPARFRGSGPPFDPRPEFPLEDDDPSSWGRRDTPAFPDSNGPSVSREREDLHFRELRTLDELERLRSAGLSEWFDPLLPLFAQDALRTGGRVEIAEEGGAIRGVSLFGSSEGVGSGFTRVRRLAERYLARMGPLGVYLEEPWRPGAEPVEVFAADLRDWTPREGLRNPVRIARREDLGPIGQLMRAELGPGVDPWLRSLPRPEETAFVCKIGGRVVGVSWLSRAGRFARGHSFVVHPRYRGLGIGTDLLLARMLWLKRSGGRLVVSEIYDGNRASRSAAERAGMALVGRMYHFRPARSEGAALVTSGSPRTAGTPSPSSR